LVPLFGLGSTVVQGRPHPGFLAVSRLLGVRDLAMAVAMLYVASRGRCALPTAALQMGVAVDIAAFSIAYAQGGLGPRGVALAVLFLPSAASCSPPPKAAPQARASTPLCDPYTVERPFVAPCLNTVL
jgi:hypothetical protein